MLVNDGSSDRTPELLDRIADADPRVRVVHLSRNFGHQAALTAGLEHARGDVVAMIDADLQDPPELISRWSTAGARAPTSSTPCASDARARPRSSWRRPRGSTSCSTGSPRSISSPTPGDFRLLDRRALDALLSMTERSRFLRGMTVWVGFSQTAVSYERDARHAGETKYTLRKMLRFSLDAIASFSHLPLQLATYVGLLSAGVAFIAIPVVIVPAHLRLLPARVRLDHDRDPAARRHPADRAGRDRRVRRAHLRRGQAPALYIVREERNRPAAAIRASRRQR